MYLDVWLMVTQAIKTLLRSDISIEMRFKIALSLQNTRKPKKKKKITRYFNFVLVRAFEFMIYSHMLQLNVK